MTRIRKKKLAQSPVRLIRVSMFVAGIVTLAMVLFQMDAFAQNKAVSKNTNLVSPEQVVLQKHQNSMLRNGNEQETLQSRRFVMTIRGLTTNNEEEKATITFETRPDWAPIGVAHLHQLLAHHFYDECRFFRVLPHFVAQFGIASKPSQQKHWKLTVLKDEQTVVHSNTRGTITFATSGPNSRTTQLFINLADNKHLDSQGFAPVAVIVDHDDVDVIDHINPQYREQPSQGKIQSQGNAYLEREFSELSYIESIRPVD